jgi:pimeloyl-ACP methyl ester carboxylesterase
MAPQPSTSRISRSRPRDTVSVFVQTKGAQLSVRDSGGDGTPIVFLSGGPGMPDYLEEIAKLVPGRRVVTYDQRGTGGSTVTNGDYSTEAHVADLEKLREHLGVEQLHLFGHSWGGMLAQLYATAHLSSVASLFLCSPTPGVGTDWVAMERDVMAYSKKRCSSGAFAMMGLRSLLGRIPRLGQRSLQKMYAQVWLNYQNPDSALPASMSRCSRESGSRRRSRLGPPRCHCQPTSSTRCFPRPRFRFSSCSVRTTSTVNTPSSSSSATPTQRSRCGQTAVTFPGSTLQPASRTSSSRSTTRTLLLTGARGA